MNDTSSINPNEECTYSGLVEAIGATQDIANNSVNKETYARSSKHGGVKCNNTDYSINKIAYMQTCSHEH